MIKGAAPWISMPLLPGQKHQQQQEEDEDKCTQEAIHILRNIKNIFMQKVSNLSSWAFSEQITTI